MNDIYQYTVPVFKKSLAALDAILTKVQGALAEKNVEEATLLEARLAPDMFPLKKQIQVACDHAKGAAGRLSGTDIPAFADEEKTIAELHARIAKTLEYISSVPESAFAGAGQPSAVQGAHRAQA